MQIVAILIILVAILGVPLFAVIAISAIINFVSSGAEIIIVPQEISGIASIPLLHSIPLFTFAGYVLAHSQASKRLIRFTKAALGWMPGGLAIVTLLACSIFTALTGASGVTIVALGGVLLPALLSEKYGEKYSLGLVTTSGSFGLLFPPSLPIIIFGVVASVSIDKLFIAGLVPGFFLIAVLSIHAMFMSKKFKIKNEKFSLNEFWKALWEAKWEIPLPVLILAGIYSGKLAISDAAAVTVMYVLIVELFLTRDVKIKDLPMIMRESMVLVGAIIIIMSVSLATTNYLIDARIPQKIFEFSQQFISNKWAFLIVLNIFLLFIGCIMDIFSALIVVVPLILPIAESYNIDLIHLGVVFLVNLQIGYITPPVGMNLFIASIRFGKSVIELYKSALIFIGLLLVCLICITYVPGLSTWFLEKPSIVGQWEFKDGSGYSDKISIKACGIYERTSGDMMEIMMNSPETGTYEIKGSKIILIDASGTTEEFDFELMQQGEKLQLTSKVDKNVKETEEVEDDWESDEDDWYSEETTSSSSGDPKKIYMSLLSTPLNKKTGKFVGNWTVDDMSINFGFNGLAEWSDNAGFKTYRYRVVSGSKIIFSEYFEDFFDEDDSEKEVEVITFKYKLENDCKLLLKNKEKNLNLEYEK